MQSQAPISASNSVWKAFPKTKRTISVPRSMFPDVMMIFPVRVIREIGRKPLMTGMFSRTKLAVFAVFAGIPCIYPVKQGILP
jgi:hypothetical protein